MTTSHRPFSLNFGKIEYTTLVPAGLFFKYTQLKDQFSKSLPEPTEGYAGDEEPSSPAELSCKFLGFVAQMVDPAIDGEYDEVLQLSLQDFEQRFLSQLDVHSYAARLLEDENYPTSLSKVRTFLRDYYMALINSKTKPPKATSELLKNSVKNEGGKAHIFPIFGGQGNSDDYFEELRELNYTYHGLISDLLHGAAERLNYYVMNISDMDKIYTQGLDFLTWLSNRDKTPDQDYLLSVPVSAALICLLQLCHYTVACKVLGLSPGEFREHMSGSTGHSQGLITAVAVASADSWEDFIEKAVKAVSLMFFIGYRCLMTYPRTTLPPTMLQDSLNNNEGKPSLMLSVRDLSGNQLDEFIEQTNKHLPENKKIVVSLINGAKNFVLSGPPESLYGLNLALRNKKAHSGLDQTRIPFSQRKMKFSNRFLPVFAPFHSHLLKPATELILQDVQRENLYFHRNDLKMPVLDTFNGQNIQNSEKEVLNKRIVECITELPVRWEAATDFSSTHLLDFGPGGVSGLGTLTHRIKEGTGTRVIFAGVLDISTGDDEYGFKQELFIRTKDSVKWAPNWFEEYQPRLIKNINGKVYVDTKFSRLLGKPPLMVPGMTPTTVHPEIVAATINAGYHIELAGGGYFDPNMMEKALEEVRRNIEPGRGIAVNLIYVNPRMLQWGIPLIKRLRERGFPLQSMSIGAGVPSLEVASEYIETLGLTHLGLKPGSVEAILQSIAIAKAHPNFPIVLQWTGGRGGGHHSFEDFHQPILQMYGKIRRCKNIVLVVGSGFGSAEDTYSYLTGDWSLSFNQPRMPFDGFLFGSRMMTAKEARTSEDAKKLITECAGVPDEKWENTYKRPTGGIITVRSEMGEPIHKIATRGVLLWKELDDKYFTLPKNKIVDALSKDKKSIIDRLNKDFQKPWFAKNSEGNCDLEDMTYEEVAYRLIELMYVDQSSKWIDVTLRNFYGDYLRRVEERFTLEASRPSFIQSYSQLLVNPRSFTSQFFLEFSLAKTQLINEEDCDFFLMCCQRINQKPVPFVPVLDERFEYFFKKDSLWQSEDLESVVDGDVQRTCILHGPVAAQFTNKVNEPVKDILDSIHERHISALMKDYYGNQEKNIPQVEYFSGTPVKSLTSLDGVDIKESDNDVIFTIGDKVLPNKEEWLFMLAGEKLNWMHALITTGRIVQGTSHVSNNIQDILAPAPNMVVHISNYKDSSKSGIVAYELFGAELKPCVEISLLDSSIIECNLIEHRTADGVPAKLNSLFSYNPGDGFSPISEIMEGRNKRIKEFYWKLWFGSESVVDHSPLDFTSTIKGEQVKISSQDISDFTHAIGNNSEAFVSRPGKVTFCPMDFSIVIGWKPIVKALFTESIDADLLKLVHLSNKYKMFPNAKPLKKDEVVECCANIRAVLNQPSGKLVEVVGTIFRSQEPVIEVTSEFFFRGQYEDFHNCFQKVTETPVQVAIKSPRDLALLKSKEWFNLTDNEIDLLHQLLTFRCQSVYKFKSADVYSSIVSRGDVYLELPTKEICRVGSINYEAGVSHGNPVVSYLSRHGNPIEQAVKFDNSIRISNEDLISKTPNNNEPYAKVSGDYNPIHVSRVFAAYVKLPGTITHGMYTSASVRSLVEEWAANSVSSRIRAFLCSFVGMVLPNDILKTTLEHVGMINGRKIIKVETSNRDSGEVVLTGEAEIEQPTTTYVFTGQGSQEQGMGMDLYESSPVARAVWDRADQHFVDTYGFSILHIVKNNPKSFTVHFGGTKGKAIRENYMSMIFETTAPNGEIQTEKIFNTIDENTPFYTFNSESGLLAATQFTQPALTLMEKASYEDIKSKGLVPENLMFAGHSLGEYSSLSSLANVMPIESLVDVVFYRGMTMQVAVPRDSLGRSNYTMCAVNPSRVSPTFTDAALRFVVEEVALKTGWLLEIVNFNIENNQYVAAGDLRALDTLTNVLNYLKINSIDVPKLQSSMSLDEISEHFGEIVKPVSAQSLAKPQPIKLERGFAVIPLPGISVPFHSSYLRPGVKPFRRFLSKKIPKSSLKPQDLIHKYIPNLTAKPFEISKPYFEDVYKLTGSETIKNIIDSWDSYQTD